MSRPACVKKPIIPSPAERERRLSPRYRCRVRGDCRPATANEVGNRWPVRVIDISGGGVGLLLSRRFEMGTLLAVELQRLPTRSNHMPLARVCRVVSADAHWLLGCVWEGTVNSEDLQSLIGASAMWQTIRARVRNTKALLENLCGRAISQSPASTV